MRSIKLLIIIVLTLLVPISAHAALTMEFYTYGGHDAVVSSFNRAALIFGAGDYQSFFAVLATASLSAAVIRIVLAVAFGSKDLHGQNYATGAIVPWLITCALFTVSVLPKGTLHIYDPTENKYQAIGGVPDIIILFAGTTNKIERAFVDMVSTSGDPMGFQAQAGGKGFMGLYKATTVQLQAADPLLDQTIANYVRDCVYLETSLRPGYVQELRRDTTDLLTTLGKAGNPAAWTVVFDPAFSPQGEAKSCQDAFSNIQTRINAPNALKNNLSGVCVEMGFDPADAAAYNDCLNRMGGVVSAQISTGKTSLEFLRTAYLAQSMDAVFSSDGADAGYANFSVLNKASGTMTAVNQWLPSIRAVILAITVALTPFLSLLMLTPFMPRAVKFVMGSFVFLTVWGTVDAIIHQFIVDYSNRVYSEIRQYNLSLDALRFFPNSTEKVLAMFGLVRASGLALSAAIASSVIGLGASVGASIGGKVMADATGTGAQAAGQMLDPGAKAAARRTNQMSAPTETLANNYSWGQRTTADYAQQMGQLSNTTGGLEATGGLGGWGQLQHGQGFTQAYRGQGDVKLNQEFMQQAQSMGIPREQAQQISAATVNHGEGLAELRRLQQQGFSGQQAADMYWQGKTVDHMQGKSIGQQEGFTMYRPAEGQDLGRWGQVSALWQGGQLLQLQGGALNVATTEQLRANYDKAYSQAISESYRADQSLGESVTRSWGNSATWSQTQAAAQQLYKATSGTVDYSKAITSTMMSSFRNSQIVDERSGQSVDKSAFAQISAGAGTPQISPLKANIEGGASWRVTTSDGKSYVVNQTAEEARSMSTSVGETHRTTLSTVRSGQYSETAQKALAQMESVQGTKTASETATISYSRAHEMRESQGQAHSRAAEMSTNLTRDFIHHAGQTQFGGGQAGDRAAIIHYETLAAQGKTQEIQEEMNRYFAARGLNPESLGANLGRVKGPDVNKAPDPEAMRENIDNGTAQIRQELNSHPNVKTTDPTSTVAGQLAVKPGGVDPKNIKKDIAANNQQIQAGQSVVEGKGQDIKGDTKGALAAPIAAVKETAGFVADDIKGGLGKIKHSATEAASLVEDAAETVPGKIVTGLADAVPQITEGLTTLSQPAHPQGRKETPQPAQQLAAVVTQEQPQPETDVRQSHQTTPQAAKPLPPKGGL